MNKRGLSTVVTTLIIVLLVLVATGIIWVVIRNLIEEGTSEISLGKFTISLDVKSVKVQNNSIDVKVKRNPGQGEITKLKFIVSDGVATQIFEEETTLVELSEQTFNLNYSGLVKDVSIVPVLVSQTGKEILGNVVDKLEFSNKQIIKNLGGVSWWRFEGGALDEIGGNYGTLNNVIFVQGKYGKAGDFSSSTGIDMGSVGSPLLTAETTIAFWINVNDRTSPARQNPFNQAYGGWGTMTLETGGQIGWYFGSNGDDGLPYDQYNSNTNAVVDNEWISIIAVRDPSDYSYKWYKNGGYLNGGNYDSSYPVINTRTLTLGDGYVNPINGLMDEFMIFNRALSESEVKALYELDLN